MELLYPLQPPNRTRPPNREMQVLALGLSRSGTDSLRTALQILGYRDVYHGFVITSSQRSDCAFWVPLLRKKLQGDRQLQRNTDFDKCLGPCEALTDGPANIFGPELMQYYPEAKVILNRRRDLDAWYSSMQKTCLQVFSWPMWILSFFDTGIFWLWQTFGLVYSDFYYGDFDRHGKTVAKQHYDELEEVLRKKGKGKWLDWSVEDGWEPLCEFLGKEVPKDVPFPDGNKGGGQFEMKMEAALQDLVKNAFKNMVLFAVGLVLVLAVVFVKRG